MGLAGLAIARWWPRRPVDPIEANALYGGRMSLNDSLILVGQTMLSNGGGASVGLEAGYAQIGSAIASRIGRCLPGAPRRSQGAGRLRRRGGDRAPPSTPR